MTLTPLLTATLAIQIHVAAALVSIVLGLFVVLRRRRDRLHRVTGYVWVVAMTVLSVSTFWIREVPVIGPFSPIHGFALLTLWTLWSGVRHAIAGRFEAHRIVFRNLYWFGLLIAGAFNFLPGRRMNEVVFGGAEALGYGVLVVAALALIVALWRQRPRPRGDAQITI